MSRINYEEFLANWYSKVLPNKPEYIRTGQALMNYLYEVHPEEYKRISSVHYYDRTDIDCFYKDELVENTLQHLKTVWNE